MHLDIVANSTVSIAALLWVTCGHPVVASTRTGKPLCATIHGRGLSLEWGDDKVVIPSIPFVTDILQLLGASR
jgi:hypothetical protein